MLIDEVVVKIKAGDGGAGAVAFNKNLMELGPAGGNGGKGGNVWVEGSSDLTLLNQFRFKKEIIADDGEDGRHQFVDGRDGKDIVIKLPTGTAIVDSETDKIVYEVLRVGEKICIARGGIGGRGNLQFKSSRNTSPTHAQSGKEGECIAFRFELKYIADVGLIGLPNVGKSSLLNELTHAKSKVANYQFTTLEPNLGVYYELILADVPGLIGGASQGKGLGIKFLKHIERTQVLFHLVSVESNDVWSDYQTVRAELKKHNKELLKKEEYIFLSKSDEVSVEELDTKIKIFKKHRKEVQPLSLLNEHTIERVKNILNNVKKIKSHNE